MAGGGQCGRVVVICEMPRLCSVPQTGNVAEMWSWGGRAVMANPLAGRSRDEVDVEIRPGSD
jgi:hypothetical protein